MHNYWAIFNQLCTNVHVKMGDFSFHLQQWNFIFVSIVSFGRSADKIFPNIMYGRACVCVRFFFHFIRLHKLCIFEMHTLLHSLNFLWHAVFLVIVFRTFLHIAYAFGHTIIGLLVLLYAKIKNLKHA